MKRPLDYEFINEPERPTFFERLIVWSGIAISVVARTALSIYAGYELAGGGL